jgi:hypothetical protein
MAEPAERLLEGLMEANLIASTSDSEEASPVILYTMNRWVNRYLKELIRLPVENQPASAALAAASAASR